MAKKLSALQDLEKQLEIVSLHKWMRGYPEKFQSACLIIRTDAKREVQRDEYEDATHWGCNGWREGSEKNGYRYFLVDDEHELSPTAQRYVAQARQDLGYFAKNTKHAGFSRVRIPEDNGKAYPENNIYWNDRNAKKNQVIEVLQRAIEIARKKSRKKELVAA